MPTPGFEYDPAFKRIFSYPDMIQELVRFLSSELDELSLRHAQLVGTEHVSKQLKKRRQDLVWQVLRAADGTFVYLALEFQSTVDKFMPLRVNTYRSLLFEQLVRQRQLYPDGRLPDVIPIVIYNGRQRWTAPLEFGELHPLRNSVHARYNISARYILMDFSTYKERALEFSDNPLALLIRLEIAESVEELPQVVDTFIGWYRQPGQEELKADLTDWFKMLLENIGDENLRRRIEGVEDMGMLAENLREWVAEYKEYKESALAQLEKGRTEGRTEGLEEGKRELLLRQIETKYGTDVREQLTETLLRHTTTEALDRFGDWIIKCESAEELFQRIRASSNGIS